MKVIGFANKYYTLWEVNINVIEYENYKTEIYNNIYIKNISIDKDKAFAKYPTVVFDENLHGRTNDFIYNKTIWKNIDTFRFGALCDTKIEDCTDFIYLETYYNNIAWDDHHEYIKDFLISSGYVFRNGELLSPRYIKRQHDIADNQKYVRDCIDNHKSISFIATTNVNDNGDIYDKDAAITYVFQKVSLQSYNGYQYYLPMLNDKAKRIKNKTIEITDYMVEETEYNELIIHIKNFKINKN